MQLLRHQYASIDDYKINTCIVLEQNAKMTINYGIAFAQLYVGDRHMSHADNR